MTKLDNKAFKKTDGIKKQQMTVIFVGLGLVFVVFVLIILNDNQSKVKQVTQEVKNFTTPASTVDAKDAWIIQSEAQMKQMKEDSKESQQALLNKIKKMKQELILNSQKKEEELKRSINNELIDASRKLRAENEKLRKQLLKQNANALKMHQKSIPDGVILPKIPEQNNESVFQYQKDGQPQSSIRDKIKSQLRTSEDIKIVKINFKKKSRKKLKHIKNNIPAGFFGQAVLLNGVDAPTGGLSKNPHPVTLQMIDDGNLPNRFKHRVKECRIISAVYGDISSERGYFRHKSMTCILKNGEFISEEVKGYVVDEGGKNGMRGRLVTKQGALIARSIWSGIAGGIGKGISQSFSTISTAATGAVESVDPNKIGQYGLTQGFGSALEKVSDWYLKRADEIYPVIEIDVGRVVDVVFTDDVHLEANLLEKYRK